MRKIVLALAFSSLLIAPVSAQNDFKAMLSSYYAYQNDGNDEAAFNLLRDVFLGIRDGNNRDIDVLDLYIKHTNSFMSYFTPCSAEEEEEKGVNACARIVFERTQINNLLLPEGHSMRAEARLMVNDFLGALEDYDQAIKIKGDVASYYTNRGNVKYRMKDNAGAIADFDKSISIDPTNAPVYYNKGMVLMKNKDYPGATAAFSSSLQYDPANTKTMLYKAISEYTSDSREAATATLNQLLAIEPANSEALYYQGMILYKNKDFAGAKGMFERSTAADDKNDKSWYFLGISAFNLQDKATACTAWNKAKTLGNDKAQKMIDDYCKAQ